MRLLQRYILFELLRVFTVILSVLTILLVFVGVFREASESGLGPFETLKILPYIVPSLLPFTIPATLLLTVSVVYGRISGDREIVAAKAAGIDALSLLWPAFFLGAILSVCSLLLTDQVIPWSMGNIQRIVTLAMEDIFLDHLRSQHQLIDPNNGVAVNVMRVDGRTLVEPTFHYTPPGGSAVIVRADSANVKFDLENQKATLHFVRAFVDAPGKRGAYFAEQDYHFPLTGTNPQAKPRHLSVHDIRTKLRSVNILHEHLSERRDIEAAMALGLGDFDRLFDQRLADYDKQLEFVVRLNAKLRTELHGRFALSSSCFFFVLVGTPFSILQARRQFLTSFAIVFMPLVAFYYPIVLLSMNLAKSGTVDPAWALWIGNLILLIVGSFVLSRALR